MTDNSLREIEAAQVLGIGVNNNIKAYVDFAAVDKKNNLVVVGWIFDPELTIKNFALVYTTQIGSYKKKRYFGKLLESGVDGVNLSRVSRPDVAYAMSMSSQSEYQHGFIIILPEFDSDSAVSVTTIDGNYVTLDIDLLTSRSSIRRRLIDLWPHSGELLKQSLEQTLDTENELLQDLQEIRSAIDDKVYSKPIATVENAVLLEDNVLLLNGMLEQPEDEVEAIRLAIDGVASDVSSDIAYYTPSVNQLIEAQKKSWCDGFVLVIHDFPEDVSDVEMTISYKDGQSISLSIYSEKITWFDLVSLLENNLVLESVLLPKLRRISEDIKLESSTDAWTRSLDAFIKTRFDARWQSLNPHVEVGDLAAVAVDVGYQIGASGILCFGWSIFPVEIAKSVSVVDQDGKKFDITDSFTPLKRKDVLQAYAHRWPINTEWVGFYCFGRLPDELSAFRALCFDFGKRGEVYVKIPVRPRTSVDQIPGVISEILTRIPEPETMWHKLYDIFNNGLGNLLNELRKTHKRRVNINIEKFGHPVAGPQTTVIVPLYGRFDFVRYQLAHFANDQEFADVELIYVVDDPRIIEATRELALRYQPLFKIPFKLVSYTRNLGFAGANNVGVSIAEAQDIVLLNSDVVPKVSGWINKLKNALATLPQAGAVGPLLLFPDDSVQHSGMITSVDSKLPGFLLNKHVGMGLPWLGGTKPMECSMLTAACLMLKKNDYLAIGGLDENYGLGDFEDSDLCMALRKLGKKLYLVPEAKLWHLERQSQTLNDHGHTRQMLTLLNAWIYKNKIDTGVIANPLEFEANK